MLRYNSILTYITSLTASSILLSINAFYAHQSSRRYAYTQQLYLGSIAESDFWIARTQNNTSLDSCKLPAIPQLDKETGTLPPRAYYDKDQNCLIAIGIKPPSNAIRNTDGDIWREGVKNCQRLVDSGFNTFRMNDYYEMCNNNENKKSRYKNKQRSPSSIAIEQMKQHDMQREMRHEVEKNFYSALQHSTPKSVLQSCHFSVLMDVPLALTSQIEGDTVQYGNGYLVRESISNALIRTKTDCLDSVVLRYCKDSPYHLDILDTLSDLQNEGLIKSISTKDFPIEIVDPAMSCGFDISYNDICGSLMNTNNIHIEVNEYKHLISSPLAGGLLTNQFHQYQEWEQLPVSAKKVFNSLICDSRCSSNDGGIAGNIDKWKRYRSIMDTLEDMALKYQVSVESISLRWLLQLDESNSISVGTKLGMDMAEEQGGSAYSRQYNLRQVLTFDLEDDDIERLQQVSGFTSSGSKSEEIDFNNKALWI